MMRHFTGAHGRLPLFSIRNETLLTTTGCSEQQRAAVPFVHGPCAGCAQFGWHLEEGLDRRPECVQMSDGSEKDLPKFVYLLQKL